MLIGMLVVSEIEDFFDPYAYPEFAGEGFEIYEAGGLGVWIVLPDTYDFESVKAIFEGEGWTYYSEAEYVEAAIAWSAEFESATGTYVIYSEDLATDYGMEQVTTPYGIEIPKDAEGNVLPAILLY